MTESIPTTRNDELDTVFLGIAQALTTQGFTAAAEVPTTGACASDYSPAQIDKALEHLLVAESWESMATRSRVRAGRRQRDLVPVRVVTRRAE